MSKKDKVINNPDEHADAKQIQKWSVWTQGPKDAKETQRTFKQTTPGQERDYKKLVSKRKFQRFEQVESVKPKKEEAPANSVSGGGVDMAPNAGRPSKTTKVFMKRRRNPRVDGRTKAYKETIKRIKERHLKNARKEIEQRYSQFAVQANPFREETEMSNKYLTSKEGSLEQAVLQSVQTEATPNSDTDTLSLPNKRYLDTREDSLEYAAIKAIAEKEYKLPRQLKDPKKEKMVGTKSGTKVVDRNDPKYKKHPEHESVEMEGRNDPKPQHPGQKKGTAKLKKGWKMSPNGEPYRVEEVELEATRVQQKKGEKHEKGDKHDEAPDKKAGESDKDWKDRTAGRVSFKSHRKSLDKVDPDELKGKHKDRDDKDIDNDGDADKSDQYLHRRRQAIATARKKGKKQDLRDRDDEAQATRSKTRPTAEEVEMDELSKKTLGSYVKKSSVDAQGAAAALGVSTGKKGGQTRDDVHKNVGKMLKRQKGIEKATDKLSKEEVEVTEAGDKIRMPAGGLGTTSQKDKARADLAKAVAAYKKKGGKVTKIKSRDRTDRERGVAQRSHFGQGPGIMGHGTGKTSPKRAHEETLAVSDVHITEKEVDVKDTRRTVDAIRAYYRSKDASRDATSDTDKGKKAKGDKEKAYAKKERGEIKKDDPNWKHRKYHTGIHGEKWDPSLASKDDHATALYKDQWRDRSRADWDKAHGKDAMAKQDRADAGEDRKRMKVIDPNWKHAKYETGEKQNGPNEAHEIGTDEYANYTKQITPGQENKAIDNKQAKKNDLIQKAANYIKQQQSTKIDDDYQVDEVKDRAELDKQIADYKAKGGKVTKLAPKHPKPATTTPAKATGKVHQTRPSLKQLSKLK